eukprot:7138101-Lingulodinium_polyedra.AAC.1
MWSVLPTLCPKRTPPAMRQKGRGNAGRTAPPGARANRRRAAPLTSESRRNADLHKSVTDAATPKLRTASA